MSVHNAGEGRIADLERLTINTLVVIERGANCSNDRGYDSLELGRVVGLKPVPPEGEPSLVP